MLDKKVQQFLDNHKNKWQDMNVPEIDGKLLYDLIIENKYTYALEIGTSTGHSSIWMAWALSKTGGKLITIEIDEDRHKQALAGFEETGLAKYIDARLADAHYLVKELKAPFDFIFSDADKDWYKNYFMSVAPRLKVGGCFTAHNIDNDYQGSDKTGILEFVDYVSKLTNFETTFNHQGSGVSISYKKAEI